MLTGGRTWSLWETGNWCQRGGLSAGRGRVSTAALPGRPSFHRVPSVAGLPEERACSLSLFWALCVLLWGYQTRLHMRQGL